MKELKLYVPHINILYDAIRVKLTELGNTNVKNAVSIILLLLLTKTNLSGLICAFEDQD